MKGISFIKTIVLSQLTLKNDLEERKSKCSNYYTERKTDIHRHTKGGKKTNKFLFTSICIFLYRPVTTSNLLVTGLNKCLGAERKVAVTT